MFKGCGILRQPFFISLLHKKILSRKQATGEQSGLLTEIK